MSQSNIVFLYNSHAVVISIQIQISDVSFGRPKF